MSQFVIITDSASDLARAYREEHGIDYAKMMINWVEDEKDHETFAYIDWDDLSAEDFYSNQKDKGIRFRTVQVTQQSYLDTFIPHLEKGEDIIYVGCSSGLSASIKLAEKLAAKELKEKFPERRIAVVDSLRAGMAQGLMIKDAASLKENGKTFDEVVTFLEEERLRYLEVGIPDSLEYLRRAGRVKASKAFFGNLFGIKPILVFNDLGENVAVEKAKGRKGSMVAIAAKVCDKINDPENDEVWVMEGACKKEEIDFLISELNKGGAKNIHVQTLGPIIGGSSGPGTIICNFKGKK